MESTAGLVYAALKERSELQMPGSAFDRLVVLYQDMVYGYAFSMLKNPFDANDAVQETFLRAFVKLETLRNRDAFPGWLKIIARRICLNLAAEREAKAGPELDESLYASAYIEAPQDLENEETRTGVRRALESLPAGHRAAVILYYFSGYSQKEIAGFLGLSVAAVKKRLQRSRDTLREEMKRMIHENMEHARPSRDDGLLRRISLTASFDMAARLGQLCLLEQMLVDGIDVNEQDTQGRTLLHWAAHSGHEEMVKLLVRNGARQDCADRDGLTPAQLAAVAGHAGIARFLKGLGGKG